MNLKDSNDLFGLIIKLKKQNNTCQVTDIIKESNIDSLTLQKWINELQEKKYINQISLNDIFVDKQYENKYVSPFKKKLYKVIKLIKTIIGIKTTLE